MKDEINIIPVCEPSITKKEISYVANAVRSGWVSSLGQYIEDFEKEFAGYIGTKYAVSVSNGTAALHLALISLGIKEGDEVIIPDLTFVATANAVAYTGAKPVFVDIDKDTWCISPEHILKKINKKTKAIIPVHLYGHPADMDMINEIADKYGLFVVEDAAEAHGAEYKSKKVGSLGDSGVFSFYGNKIITTGEGGMITTDNESIYKRAIFLRDHAMSKGKRYWHSEIGYNYRLTNIQAALGLAQLGRIDKLINRKIRNYKLYSKYLNNMDDLKINVQREWAKNVYWMVCVVLNHKVSNRRDHIIKNMRIKGVDTRPFFYPVSRLPMYKTQSGNHVASSVSKRGINLPSGTNLSEEDISYICKILQNEF